MPKTPLMRSHMVYPPSSSQTKKHKTYHCVSIHRTIFSTSPLPTTSHPSPTAALLRPVRSVSKTRPCRPGLSLSYLSSKKRSSLYVGLRSGSGSDSRSRRTHSRCETIWNSSPAARSARRKSNVQWKSRGFCTWYTRSASSSSGDEGAAPQDVQRGPVRRASSRTARAILSAGIHEGVCAWLIRRQRLDHLGAADHQRDGLGLVPDAALRVADDLAEPQHPGHHARLRRSRLDDVLRDDLGPRVAHVLGVREVLDVLEQVVHAADVLGLEAGDAQVEVDGPRRVDDGGEGPAQLGDGVRGEAEVRQAQVRREVPHLGPVAVREAEALGRHRLEHAGLCLLGGRGAREAVDGLDVGLADDLGEEVSAEGARGAGEDDGLAVRGDGAGLPLVKVRVLGDEPPHDVDLVLGVDDRLAGAERVEVSRQRQHVGVLEDDVLPERLAAEVDAALDVPARRAGLETIDAGLEEVRVLVDLGEAERGAEEVEQVVLELGEVERQELTAAVTVAVTVAVAASVARHSVLGRVEAAVDVLDEGVELLIEGGTDDGALVGARVLGADVDDLDHLGGHAAKGLGPGVGLLDDRAQRLEDVLPGQALRVLAGDDDEPGDGLADAEDDDLLHQLVLADVVLVGDGQHLLAVDQRDAVVEPAEVSPGVRDGRVRHKGVAGAVRVGRRVVRVGQHLGGEAVEHDALVDVAGDGDHAQPGLGRGQRPHVVPVLVAGLAERGHELAHLGAAFVFPVLAQQTRLEYSRSVVADEVDTGLDQAVAQVVRATAAAVQDELEPLQRLDAALGLGEQLQRVRHAVQAAGLRRVHGADERCAGQRQVGVVDGDAVAGVDGAEQGRDTVVVEQRQRQEGPLEMQAACVWKMGLGSPVEPDEWTMKEMRWPALGCEKTGNRSPDGSATS
ncbi:major ampullate spidroin 1 MaSp1 [Colletotrichum higginsianum]|nr:major ampullate spidroin 1 MaSp1 [Colletotrichum higginsianum]